MLDFTLFMMKINLEHWIEPIFNNNLHLEDSKLGFSLFFTAAFIALE